MSFRRIEAGILPALSEVGKIKVGGLSPRGVQKRGKADGDVFHPPVKFDHFEVRRLTRLAGDKVNLDPDPLVMARLIERAGEDPARKCACGASVVEIPCMLPFDDPDDNFRTAFQAYSGRKLWCQGNGIRAERRNEKTGAFEELATCQCEYLRDPETQKRTGIQCKPNGSLSLILPDAGTVGGVYVYRTTSWVSIRNIVGAMRWLASLTGGVLAGLPLKLVLIRREHEVPGEGGKTMKTTSPTVTLLYDLRDASKPAIGAMLEDASRLVEYRRAAGVNVRELAEAHRAAVRALPPGPLDLSTEEETAAEFYGDEEAEPGSPNWRPGAELEELMVAAGWTPGKAALRLGDLGGDVAALRAELEGIAKMGPGRLRSANAPAAKPADPPPPETALATISPACVEGKCPLAGPHMDGCPRAGKPAGGAALKRAAAAKAVPAPVPGTAVPSAPLSGIAVEAVAEGPGTDEEAGEAEDDPKIAETAASAATAPRRAAARPGAKKAAAKGVSNASLRW